MRLLFLGDPSKHKIDEMLASLSPSSIGTAGLPWFFRWWSPRGAKLAWLERCIESHVPTDVLAFADDLGDFTEDLMLRVRGHGLGCHIVPRGQSSYSP